MKYNNTSVRPSTEMLNNFLKVIMVLFGTVVSAMVMLSLYLGKND